ncbi:MAG TPA: cyclic nucleotide-binding domain-containing protein [Myxococcota bacterium]|nr:cyclic nucleotide-binding domain-containing protein [Myxococcota bacterium]
MFRRLGIEPGEGRFFLWGAAALALAGWADVSVKNVSETLFVKRVGVAYLPLAYLLNAILLVGTTFVVVQLAARADRPRLLPKVLLGLALALLPFWYWVEDDAVSAFVLLVLASKQFQSISLLAYTLAMTDLLDGRQAKRLFAPLMAGYTLGSIVGSFASEPIGRVLGIEALLPVAAAAFALAGLSTLPLAKSLPRGLDRDAMRGPWRGSGAQRPASDDSSFRELWSRSELFRLLFIGAVASGLLGPMLYFQFQFVADRAAAGEEGLLALYAQFRGWIHVGVLATQLTVTANLFKRIGLPLSVLLSPIAYLLGFAGLSIRFDLASGVVASAATKLPDSAVYDPAMRILANLFPERDRLRATGLLEGPAKRAGGAVGNILCLAAVHFASAIAVGYIAIPIALSWLVGSISLWRRYPALLLRASARRARSGDELDIAELIDSNTVRSLSVHLAGPEPAAAIALVSEARPGDAANALAEAARAAPAATRARLIAALDRVLKRAPSDAVESRQASEDLATLLAETPDLSERERANIVQAYSRVTPGEAAIPVLTRALADASAGVRLAAATALDQRGQRVEGVGDVALALGRAVESEDALERRVALDELRARVLRGARASRTPDPKREADLERVPASERAVASERDPDFESDLAWRRDLAQLARLLARDADRARAADALAEIARRHGAAAASVRDAMLEHRNDADPRVRAALLRYCGYAGLTDCARWMVEQAARDGGRRSSAVRDAAREGLIALGPEVADVLLTELSFGTRSTRNAVLPIVRRLQIEPAKLRALFDRELESIRRKLVYRHALSREPAAAIVAQRLHERIEEGFHTALLLLAAIHGEDRFAELGERIKRGGGAGLNAILLEALDALLAPGEKAQLMPLMGDRALELRAHAAASSLGIAPPDLREAALALLEDPDELTRMLTAETLATALGASRRLAGARDLDDHREVLSPIEIALHLKSLPLFEELTTRQLMNLANEVHEQRHPAGVTIFREGEPGDCLYLIVEGQVRVTRGETLLREQGPKSFFGEIALLEGESRTATIATLTPARFLRLDRDDLLRLMEELPAIAIGICQTLSRRVSELTSRIHR